MIMLPHITYHISWLKINRLILELRDAFRHKNLLKNTI